MAQTIVTLTSVPNRVKKLVAVLDSLNRGTVKPDMIVINIPEQHQNTKQLYNIPHNVKKYVNEQKNITINRTMDYGPVTKLLPTLKEYTDEDTYIITVDDDHMYPVTFIEGLIRGYNENGCPCGYSGVYVDAVVAEETENMVQVDILEGFAGVVYRRGDFDETIYEYLDECMKDSLLRQNDDIVVSNYMALHGIPMYHISTETCSRQIIKGKKTVTTDELRKGEMYIAQVVNSYIVLYSNIWNGIHVRKRERLIEKALSLGLEVNPDDLIMEKSLVKPDEYMTYMEKIQRVQEYLKKSGNESVTVIVNYNNEEEKNGLLFEYIHSIIGVPVKVVCSKVKSEIMEKVEKSGRDTRVKVIGDPIEVGEDATEVDIYEEKVHVLAHYSDDIKTSQDIVDYIKEQDPGTIIAVLPNDYMYNRYTLLEILDVFREGPEHVYGVKSNESMEGVGIKDVKQLQVQGMIVGQAKNLLKFDGYKIETDDENKLKCVFARFANEYYQQKL